MRVQKLALAVGLVSALGSSAALALGLGEIKLNSTLNQPLDAEIKLLQTRGLTDNEIKVRLASSEDFERAGVDRGYGLSDLRFEVDHSGPEPVVRISSRTPIREPFLNFLVETRWPSGRLLREYTLLMDLPAFSTSAASQPVRAAERERQQVRREAPAPRPQQPVAPRQQVPVPAPVESAPEYVEPEQPTTEPEAVSLPADPQVESGAPADTGSRVYGPVEADKTLWEIARDTRETRDLSIQQNMLAIQRLNPEAFINNNINLLKKGSVLRLPSAEDVRALTLNEAVTQVATQNDAWRDRVGDVADSTLGAPLDGRAAELDAAVSETPEGRVSLAAPGDNESVLSGTGSGAGESEALSGELTSAEEELDKSRLESAELEERIGELDEQIDTMERLVEVSNEELRAVQDASAQADDTLSDAAPVEVPAIEDTVGSDAAEEIDASQAEPADAPEEAPVPVEEESDARNRVVVQTSSEPTLIERLMDNIQLVGVGAGVLLAALFGFFTWRRRKEEEEAIRQVEAEMAAESSLAEEPELEIGDDHLSAVEEFESSESLDLDGLGEIETDDPVAEAEIHLSLGQYQEAEAKLHKSLEAAPSNVDARLMLLEVYAHQQDAARFDDHYRQLLGYSDGPAADRAARLRETIADAGTFELPAIDYSSESLEAAQLDDLGAGLESADEQYSENDFSASFDDLEEFSAKGGQVDGAGIEDSGSEDDLSLLDDLDLELDSDSPSADSAGTAEDTFELDLDLDLGGDLDLDAGADSDTLEMTEGVQAEPDTGDDFNLDDFGSEGELDLDSLDLDGDFGLQDAAAETGAQSQGDDDMSFDLDLESPAEAGAVADESGLDFDLDLTPMEDSSELDAEESTPQAELDSDELESFGDDLGELDLDSIDLGDFELDGEGDSPASPQNDTADLAVAEAPAKTASSAPAGPDALEEDLGFDLEGDLDSELNLLEGGDEVSTKLELAQAYLDMGDKDGAREILGEVAEEAKGEPQQRAREMLERMT